MKFDKYVNIDNDYRFSQDDLEHFGDRSPPGYHKIRLVSKLQNTVTWLFATESVDQDGQPEQVFHLI